MKTEKQIAASAAEFAERWKGRGNERSESQPFWIDLLTNVFGIETPSDGFITFEEHHKVDASNYIDGRIPSTRVLIEQKSKNKDLREPIRQSDGSLLNPFQQARRYVVSLPVSEHPRWIVTCNFAEFLVYDMEQPNGEPEQILQNELSRLSSNKTIASVYRGYYVIIPTQYVLRGSVPATYYIDQLMSYLQKPYYVCMLSAAEMLGAAHQRPQQFSVMTTFPKRRTVSTRNVTIDWFYRDGLPEEALITKNTETGTIRISNPLLTAADLVQYQQHVGGLSRVATILEELSEQIDINNQFAPLATYVKKVVWQRLGYILEDVVGEKKLADDLYEQLRTSSGYFKYQPLSTSVKDNSSVRDSRWKININVEIETDDI